MFMAPKPGCEVRQDGVELSIEILVDALLGFVVYPDRLRGGKQLMVAEHDDFSAQGAGRAGVGSSDYSRPGARINEEKKTSNLKRIHTSPESSPSSDSIHHPHLLAAFASLTRAKTQSSCTSSR
jgi:hypothetical protein